MIFFEERNFSIASSSSAFSVVSNSSTSEVISSGSMISSESLFMLVSLLVDNFPISTESAIRSRDVAIRSTNFSSHLFPLRLRYSDV